MNNVMASKSIGDIINNEYLGYAMYVLENRAIPCYIDGMKSVHRKLFYAMQAEHRGKKVKINDLGSISKYGYHHGEASAMGAAITLAAPWNNNVPMFTAHGNFGSRLIQEAAAPRYIFATENKEMSKYFSDSDVCTPRADEESPEPMTYLPNIPWILVNGIEGIAVGFACRYLPHLPKDIARACLLEANGQLNSTHHVIPVTFPGFKGEVVQETPSKVVTRGIVERIKRNVWEITEAPWGFDREQLFNHLDKLVEANKIIDFDDNCDASGFRFTVKLDVASDKKCQANPIGYFKLEKAFTENYTALDENGKLCVFESKLDIIKAFVPYRVAKIKEQLSFDIAKNIAARDWLAAKLSFIKMVVNRTIDLRDYNKAELVKFLNAEFKTIPGVAEKLSGIPVSDMTADQIVSLEARIRALDEEIDKLSMSVPMDIFKERLKGICR